MGRLFRELVKRPEGLFGFGVGNALDASEAEKEGAECIYVSGYTVAMYKMLPDMGMMNMVEVLQEVSAIARTVAIPIVADIDDGYGNALNAMRTASEFIGREHLDMTREPWQVRRVAALHIEDQKYPKRCGHISGKEVVSIPEITGKIRAVRRVMNAFDPETVIIARTDVYNSKDSATMAEAIRRLAACAEAGADLGWCEFNDCKREGPMRLAEGVHKALKNPNYPLAFNYSPSLKWREESSPMTFAELNDTGFKFIFITIAAGHASSFSVSNYMRALNEKGAEALWELQDKKIGHPTESNHQMARVPAWQKLEQKYVPGAAQKQHAGEGFDERLT